MLKWLTPHYFFQFKTVKMVLFLPKFGMRTLALAVMGLVGGLLPLFSVASDSTAVQAAIAA